MNEYLWVEEGDRLFKENYTPAYCAHFGWEYHQKLAFSTYLSGYKLAADVLVEKALEEAQKHHIEVIDTLIYPIIFLYRHYMELSIKNLYVNYCHQEEPIEILKTGHKLFRAWEYLKPFVIEVYGEDEDELKDVLIIQNYIQQFEEISEASTEYRYPVNKKGNVVHKVDKYLNLKNLIEKMQKFANFCDGLMGAMDYQA